jgi:hypothetical protein
MIRSNLLFLIILVMVSILTISSAIESPSEKKIRSRGVQRKPRKVCSSQLPMKEIALPVQEKQGNGDCKHDQVNEHQYEHPLITISSQRTISDSPISPEGTQRPSNVDFCDSVGETGIPKELETKVSLKAGRYQNQNKKTMPICEIRPNRMTLFKTNKYLSEKEEPTVSTSDSDTRRIDSNAGSLKVDHLEASASLKTAYITGIIEPARLLNDIVKPACLTESVPVQREPENSTTASEPITMVNGCSNLVHINIILCLSMIVSATL